MTPEQLTEFNDMKTRLANLERVENVPFIENISRRLSFSGSIVEDGASSSGTNILVRNVTDDGAESVAAPYNGILTLTDEQGNSYRIGYYT